jgi:hypothetical protein
MYLKENNIYLSWKFLQILVFSHLPDVVVEKGDPQNYKINTNNEKS